MSKNDSDIENPAIAVDTVLAVVDERRLDPNFKKEVFDRKVQIHINCGYTKEMAEKKVLWDYNGLFNEAMGGRPRKRQTGADGYYR
jgi:hypothetical protein